MSIGSVSMDWGLQSGHSRCSFESQSVLKRESRLLEGLDVPCKPTRTESGCSSMASFDTLPDDQWDRLEDSCSRAVPKRVDSCASRVSCWSTNVPIREDFLLEDEEDYEACTMDTIMQESHSV